MTSKISIDNRELLQKISTGEAAAGTDFGNAIVRELAAFRLAAMDGEPVAYMWDSKRNDIDAPGFYFPEHLFFAESNVKQWGGEVIPLYRHAQQLVVPRVTCWSCRNEVEISAIGDCDGRCPKCDTQIHLDEEPYTSPQPAPDRDQVRREHAEWSQATFGDVGPVGPLKHLSKEALEAAAEPDDLSEWADMQFLLWDAQRRAGITDEQITQAMIDKLAVNKQRSWPEPKDGEPRLHIKEQPVPVVEREPIAWLNDAYLARGVVDGEAGSEDAGPGYIPVYREAGPQPAAIITFYRDGIEAAAKWIDQQREAYDSEHGRHDLDTGSFEFGNDAQREYSSTLEELAEGIRGLHPNAGNSPVIPDGYVMVPKEPTQAMCAAFNDSDYGRKSLRERYVAMLAAAPQEVK